MAKFPQQFNEQIETLLEQFLTLKVKDIVDLDTNELRLELS